MQYTCFIGVDVSKRQLDIACLQNEKPALFFICKNDDAAVTAAFTEIFEEVQLEIGQTLICAEHTGHYSNILMNCMVKNGYQFWLESPYQISKSQGIQRGKSDQVDAERIALYARRFSDKASLVKPSNTCIEGLSYLASERNLLMADLAKYKVSNHRSQNVHR